MIWWAMGAVVGAVGVALLVWALLWDRSRGRLRCPKCWYAMEGAPAGDDGRRLCPECGRRATERGLRRTRRRWRWARVAVLVLLGAAMLAVQPKVKRDGWMGLAPTRALIELAPVGGMDGVFGLELRRRIGNEPRRDGSRRASMTAGQQLALFRRMAKGNWLARPCDEQWRASYGKILETYLFTFKLVRPDPRKTRKFMDGTPATDELRHAIEQLFRTPATLHVQTRERWPRDVAPLIETIVEHGWLWPAMEEVNIRWSAGDQSGEGRARGFAKLPITSERDEVEVDLEVDVVQRMALPDPESRVLFTEQHTLEWQIVDGIDDVMTPLRSAELDAWLVSWMQPEIRRGDLVTFALPWGRDCPIDISDVAFGLRIEIFENGEQVAMQRARWIGYYGNGGKGAMGTGERWTELKAALQERGDSGKWTVRLRTDPVEALYMIDAERYWDGELTLPLTINIPPPPGTPPPPPSQRSEAG